MSEVFRPTSEQKKYVLWARRTGSCLPSSFRVRNSFWEKRQQKEPLNKRVLGRIHGRLHYLASHSPEAVSKQWKQADRNFYKAHFGTQLAGMRYSNTYTAHSWL